MHCYSCGHDVNNESPACSVWSRKKNHQDGCNRGNVEAYEAVGHHPCHAVKYKTMFLGNNGGYWLGGAVESDKCIKIENLNYLTLLNSTPTINNSTTMMANAMTELEYNGDNDKDTVVIDNTTEPTHTISQPKCTTPPITNMRQAWKHILHTNNIQQHPMAEQMLDTTKIQRAVEWAILDSGATGHFLVKNAPMVNKREAKPPIVIKLPDGGIIRPTHTGNLDIPWLPDRMTE